MFIYERMIKVIKEYRSLDRLVSYMHIEYGKNRFYRVFIDQESVGDYDTKQQADDKFYECCCNVDGLSTKIEQVGMF